MSDVTRILTAIQRGDRRTAVEALPIVYQEPRQLASQTLRRQPPGQALQATALVHEAHSRPAGTSCGTSQAKLT